MSRCFPYAPPAHLRDGARGEAVSEPFKIKLRKEKNGKVIAEHGKGKKDREERKREKKDRRKERKLRKEEGKVEYGSIEENKKRKEVAAESSGITEEHGEPVCIQQSPCYLSDGSLSNKRRKVDQLGSSGVVGASVGGLVGGSVDGGGGKGSGNILRIRLPLRKHKEPDVSTIVSAIPAYSVSQQNGVIYARAQEKVSCSVDYSEKNESSARVTLSEKPLPKNKSQTTPLLDEKAQPKLTKKEKNIHKVDSLYKALTEKWNWNISTSQFELNDDQNSPYKSLPEDWNWNISTSQFELNDDDQEWLFGTKSQERNKTVKAWHDMPCSLSSNSWPMVTYLPEADVYSLPYTIPF